MNKIIEKLNPKDIKYDIVSAEEGLLIKVYAVDQIEPLLVEFGNKINEIIEAFNNLKK